MKHVQHLAALRCFLVYLQDFTVTSVVAVARVTDQIEYRQTTFVGDNGFTVEQERMSGQSRHCVDGKRKTAT